MRKERSIEGRAGRRGRRSGFTIVELMLVIAIIAIIGAIGVFTLTRTGQERAMRSLGEEVTSRMLQARMTAISSGRPIELSFTRGSGGVTTMLMERHPAPIGERPGRCDPNATTEDLRTTTYDPSSGDYRGAAVNRISPDVQGTLAICFLPSGRLIDAQTGQPFASDLDAVDGNAYLEIATVQGDDVGVTFAGQRRRVYRIPLTGMVERMPPGFSMTPQQEEQD